MSSPLDIKSVMVSLCDLIEQFVGSQVSTMGNPPNQARSIFLARSLPPKPKMPFITVDYLKVRKEGLKEALSFINPDTGFHEEVHVKTVTLMVSVYDAQEGSSASLCGELQDRLSASSGADLFNGISGFELYDVSDFDTSGALLQTGYQEVSRMIIKINCNVTYTNTSSDVIESSETTAVLVEGDSTNTAVITAPSLYS